MINASLRTCRKCYTGASNWRSWWKYWCFRKPFWNPFREIVEFAIGVPQNGRSLSHSAESGKTFKKSLRGASISMPFVLYVWCFWHYFGPWAIAKSSDRWSKSMKFKAPSLFHVFFFVDLLMRPPMATRPTANSGHLYNVFEGLMAGTEKPEFTNSQGGVTLCFIGWTLIRTKNPDFSKKNKKKLN